MEEWSKSRVQAGVHLARLVLVFVILLLGAVLMPVLDNSTLFAFYALAALGLSVWLGRRDMDE